MCCIYARETLPYGPQQPIRLLTEEIPYLKDLHAVVYIRPDSLWFTCFVPSETFTVAWVINGESLSFIGDEALKEREITASGTLLTV